MAEENLKVGELAYEHFDQISSDYHQLEFWGHVKTKWIAEVAIEYLEIQDSESIVDLGGGNGDLLNEICNHKKVKAFCIDKSLNMQAVGQTKHASNKSLEFVSLEMKDILKFEFKIDKIMAMSSIHFIPEQDLQFFFETIYKKLSKSGKILILTRPKVPNLPLITTAQKSWDSTPTHLIEIPLANAGFKVDTVEKIYKHILPKERWYEHFRRRFISTINEGVISDQQIEKEVKELDEALFKGKDIIEFDDISIFIVGSK